MASSSSGAADGLVGRLRREENKSDPFELLKEERRDESI